MKRLSVVFGLLICFIIASCESRQASKLTSDPKADSPSSGAKMLDSGGKIHTDTTIIDSNNYGRPKN